MAKKYKPQTINKFKLVVREKETLSQINLSKLPPSIVKEIELCSDALEKQSWGELCDSHPSKAIFSKSSHYSFSEAVCKLETIARENNYELEIAEEGKNFITEAPDHSFIRINGVKDEIIISKYNDSLWIPFLPYNRIYRFNNYEVGNLDGNIVFSKTLHQNRGIQLNEKKLFSSDIQKIDYAHPETFISAGVEFPNFQVMLYVCNAKEEKWSRYDNVILEKIAHVLFEHMAAHIIADDRYFHRDESIVLINRLKKFCIDANLRVMFVFDEKYDYFDEDVREFFITEEGLMISFTDDMSIKHQDSIMDIITSAKVINATKYTAQDSDDIISFAEIDWCSGRGYVMHGYPWSYEDSFASYLLIDDIEFVDGFVGRMMALLFSEEGYCEYVRKGLLRKDDE